MLILVILNLVKSLEMVWVHQTVVYIFKTLKFCPIFHPARLLDRPEYFP